MPQVQYTVQDGAGAPQATPPAATATAGNVITCAPVSTAGINSISYVVAGQDELVATPTLTINQTNKTCTFTAAARPWSLVMQATINGGLGLNGVPDPTTTTRFKVECLTAAGAPLMASNEQGEHSASFGWVPIVNGSIRTPGSGISALTGDVSASGTGSVAATVVGLTGSGGVVTIPTGVAAPTIKQADAAGATGASLTIQAQKGSATGGDLNLRTGAGSNATTAAGGVHVQPGGTDSGQFFWAGSASGAFNPSAVNCNDFRLQFNSPNVGWFIQAINNSANFITIETTGKVNFDNGGGAAWLTMETGLNIAFFATAGSYGGGAGVLFLANRTTFPTTAPVGGALILADGGALKGVGSSGTITTMASSEPHCPVCGFDFMEERESPKYGYLAVCLQCLADEMGDRPWILRKKVS